MVNSSSGAALHGEAPSSQSASCPLSSLLKTSGVSDLLSNPGSLFLLSAWLTLKQCLELVSRD